MLIAVRIATMTAPEERHVEQWEVRPLHMSLLRSCTRFFDGSYQHVAPTALGLERLRPWRGVATSTYVPGTHTASAGYIIN